MRIAFYAPLKPPTHPTPSGDRTIARSLIALLRGSGYEVDLASRLRSLDRAGDLGNQLRIERRATRSVNRLVARYRLSSCPPQLWLSYHQYYRAPDLLGPAVSERLGIPYVVAEASHAPRRLAGPWSRWARRVMRDLAGADLVVAMNRDDLAGLRPLVRRESLVTLAPFVPGHHLGSACESARAASRARIARRYAIDRSVVWLLTVGMMRTGRKVRSYGLLASVLARVRDLDWHLLVVGGGDAQAVVAARMGGLGAARVSFLGALGERGLADCYRAADVFVWPGVDEPLGMVFLEAQAGAAPVLGVRTRGVGDLVADGESGFLVRPAAADELAQRLAELIGDRCLRRSMGRCGRRRVEAEHSPAAAARVIAGALEHAMARGRRRRD